MFQIENIYNLSTNVIILDICIGCQKNNYLNLHLDKTKLWYIVIRYNQVEKLSFIHGFPTSYSLTKCNVNEFVLWSLHLGHTTSWSTKWEKLFKLSSTISSKSQMLWIHQSFHWRGTKASIVGTDCWPRLLWNQTSHPSTTHQSSSSRHSVKIAGSLYV